MQEDIQAALAEEAGENDSESSGSSSESDSSTSSSFGALGLDCPRNDVGAACRYSTMKAWKRLSYTCHPKRARTHSESQYTVYSIQSHRHTVCLNQTFTER